MQDFKKCRVSNNKQIENVNSFNKPAGPIVLRVTQDIAIIIYKSIFYALVIQWNPFNAVTMGQKIWPKNGWPYYRCRLKRS